VPNSSGVAPPRAQVPPGACDCHLHIYDAVRFPPAPPAPRFQTNARVEEYQLLQRRLGTTRSVVVTPAPYTGKNLVTLDAIARLGPNARGVVVVRPEVTDAELEAFDKGGVRGIRFSLARPATATLTLDMVEPLAKRVHRFGWHVQFFMRGDQIVAAADLLYRLPTQLVFDHMGALPQPDGVLHPGFAVIHRLVDRGRAWVKLSGAYIQSAMGADGGVLSTTTDFNPAARVAEALIKAAPERMVWGSDWPHPDFGPEEKPDDANLLDLLSKWAPNEATRRRILVSNPQTLYGFAA
jgi:predicted TIM-barrel fold metal-dependent hydrolase